MVGKQRRFIPTSRDALKTLQTLDFSKGYNTQLANDATPPDQLVKAVDTRIPTLGRQKTRKGCDPYSTPAGETLDQSQTSATGAADRTIGLATWRAAKYTAGANGRLTKVELSLKNGGSGPVIVEVYSDNSGSPGTLLAQSSIPPADLVTSYGWCVARFIEAPEQVSGTSYWVVAYIQDDGSGVYYWDSTTTATTSKVSTSSGAAWASTTYALHLKTYVATSGPVLGFKRAYKSDGTKKSLLAHGTNLYTINDGTGALTSIKSGLSASATRYSFAVANDTVYYTNGFDAPRKWDFTTEAALAVSPGTSTMVVAHKARMFYVSAVDQTKVVFSNATAFETFDSTDFFYVPAPKSPDPITKLVVLNDNLVIFTRTTKWVLTGDNISNMNLRQASGTKGTIAPDSVVVIRNHVYFASDDGFYRWNGSTDELLSDAITNDYLDATNRTAMSGAYWNNRYYLFYTSAGGSENSRCWVHNLNYNSMESNDTGTYIQKTAVWGGSGDSNEFVQCSNLVGAAYYAEDDSNNYDNLGRKLEWELRTRYEHYGNPAAEKHVKRWYPRFTAAQSDYPVLCQYDRDFEDDPGEVEVDLVGGGYLLGGPELLGTFTIGVTTLIAPKLAIPAKQRYVQRRYSRTGVGNPVEFLGDTQYYSIKRVR